MPRHARRPASSSASALPFNPLPPVLLLLSGVALATVIGTERWPAPLLAVLPAPKPRPLPQDFAISAQRDALLFSQLEQGDRAWQPQAIPIPGGGTRYTYKRRAGDPPLSLEQIRWLIRNPPSFSSERQSIRRLLTALRRAGAQVVLGPPRKFGAAGEWDPSRVVLRIRPDVPAKGSREFLRVLNHEAIHVAQSCRRGRINAMPMPLGLSRSVDPQERRNLAAPLYANATPQERVLEEEAYANQDNLALGVQLLAAHCRR